MLIRKQTSGYTIECWYIDYDGQRWGRCTKEFNFPFFKGRREIQSLEIYPVQFHKDSNGRNLVNELEERGKRVFELHRRAPVHIEYNGATLPLSSLSPSVKVFPQPLFCGGWVLNNVSLTGRQPLRY